MANAGCGMCATSVTTAIVLFTEKCASFSKMKRQLYFDLDQKNELIEQQWKTIQALKQEVKPQVEKKEIKVQFNFLVPVSGNHSAMSAF